MSRTIHIEADGEIMEPTVKWWNTATSAYARLSFCVRHGGDGSDVSKLVGLDTHMCGYSRGDISIQ